MTLKREIKDAYIEGGNSIYVKTHSNAVYVDENEIETLTQRLDNVKDSIAEHTSQLNDLANDKVDKSKVTNNLLTTEEGYVLDGRQGKILKDLIDSYKVKLNLSSGTLNAFTSKISDMMSGNFSIVNVQGNTGVQLENSPITTTETCWFVVLSMGIPNRCAQLAIQVFTGGNQGRAFIRVQHDNASSTWKEITK